MGLVTGPCPLLFAVSAGVGGAGAGWELRKKDKELSLEGDQPAVGCVGCAGVAGCGCCCCCTYVWSAAGCVCEWVCSRTRIHKCTHSRM